MLTLDKNKKYLLACSYGPDSMALFFMLKNEGYIFDAALVNYHLRKESDDEMNRFVKTCKKNNINYHVKSLTSKSENGNIEALCREIRYDFFKELSDKYGYDAVLVAHHQDDHIETYLMQKSRKNLVNYYGISEYTIIKGVNIIRPLLRFSKKELLNYCLDNNIDFSIDKTNLENDYLRNRIRHEHVEKMSKEERKTILDEIEFKNYVLSNMLNSLQSLNLNKVDVLLALDDTEFCYAINILANNFELNISRNFCNEIKKILMSDKPNVTFSINSDLMFVKSFDECYFDNNEQCEYFFILKEPSILDTDYFYLNFLNDSSNRNVFLNDYPLIIRNLKNDDEIEISGYMVKANRLFIDWKMPLRYRKKWPVIVNKDGKCIYTPRYQKDFVKTDDINFYVK